MPGGNQGTGDPGFTAPRKCLHCRDVGRRSGAGEIELSAPGGWYRDGLGTDSYRTNGNLILSTAPKHVLQESGEVNKHGFITRLGRTFGVLRHCVDGVCGYYQWLQGTSMASPHASGVAALAVSRHGSLEGAARGLGWAGLPTRCGRS